MSRSLESGGYPWRYSRISVAVCGMGRIFGVHVAIVILGFGWHIRFGGSGLGDEGRSSAARERRTALSGGRVGFAGAGFHQGRPN